MIVSILRSVFLRSVFLRPVFLRWAFLGLFGVTFVVFQPFSVQAQVLDTQALLDRIDRLERDIRTLNRQISTLSTSTDTAVETPKAGLPAPKKLQFTEGEGAVSRVLVRQNALEQEVRNATGLAESMAHNIDLVNARLDKLVVDLDYRLARLEGTAPGTLSSSVNGVNTPTVSAAPSPGGVSKVETMAAPTEPAPAYSKTPGQLGTVSQSGLDRILAKKLADGFETQVQMAPSTLPQTASLTGAPTPPQTVSETQGVVAPENASAPAPSAPPAAVVPKVSAEEQYKIAFNLTRQARYQEAETAFKGFIEAFADDPLAGNATYWLGETYYVRKNFMQAAQVFFQAYQKFPKGTKAPDSLLKLGMSMAAMEKTSEACTTFGKLQKEFGADLKPNIERALNKQTKRLACK